MKVLFVSSEVVPFAKTGGLADVSGSLPLALEKLGVEIKIFMPKYKIVKVKGDKTIIGQNIEVFFIENKKYFDREQLYGDRFGDYPDNFERFAYFSRASLELLKQINFKPHIIHCNDWQSSLIPVYLKTLYKNDLHFCDIKTILTIHNLSYQGIFDKSQFSKSGLGWELFTIDGLEYYDKVNVLKGGILFSDLVNTVSPTYAKEIQTKEFGYGLEGVLQKRSGDLYGILNGVDYNVWDPAIDKYIVKNDTVDSIEKKNVNKEDLQKVGGLKVDKKIPLLGLISRLADQKGLDLVSEIISDIFKLNAQFILLGTGDNKYHVLFEKIAKRYLKKASINLRFDEILAQKIYAGCDLFLMPSRFEPCGLGQMICLKYGAIPIVRSTGGLKDTIYDFDEVTKTGNGFVFSEYSSNELLGAIKKAIRIYKDKEVWQALVKRAMGYDFSWESSAKKYLELYKKVCK
ncbi:MAG: glycogen synthase GlgA [Candidatus Omnitrophica bacterium]|nr:glycogen synthase GlgA [Candidatus Omnitrophota bacterium]